MIGFEFLFKLAKQLTRILFGGLCHLFRVLITLVQIACRLDGLLVFAQHLTRLRNIFAVFHFLKVIGGVIQAVGQFVERIFYRLQCLISADGRIIVVLRLHGLTGLTDCIGDPFSGGIRVTSFFTALIIDHVRSVGFVN